MNEEFDQRSWLNPNSFKKRFDEGKATINHNLNKWFLSCLSSE